MPILFIRKWCYQNNYYNAGDIVNDLTRREYDALYGLPKNSLKEICAFGSVEELEKIKARNDKKNKKNIEKEL